MATRQRSEIVSERFHWHSATDQIEDVHNRTLRPASDYSAKVDVYEDRVRKWFLDIALRETGESDAPGDYVALSIALAYVEGVEQYRRGAAAPQRQRGMWFRESAARIFPLARPDALNQLWKAVRCSLFHSGFTEGPVLVSRQSDEALSEFRGFLYINPAAFVRAVLNDFDQFLRELREKPNDTIARNFQTLWDKRWEVTEPLQAHSRMSET
jgi:hypothetical protein